MFITYYHWTKNELFHFVVWNLAQTCIQGIKYQKNTNNDTNMSTSKKKGSEYDQKIP